MASYFDGENDSSTIICDEKILLPEYLPDAISQREKELQYIADCIKPMLKRNNPQNLFIYGPSGTGKTTCLKYLIRELSEQSSAILPIYVNCWEDQTTMAIYNRIIEGMRLPIPRRGLAADEVFDKILQFVRNYKKPILLILDEIDAIRSEELLYVISRSNEKMLVFGIIGISNGKSMLSKLDPRVKSSLRFSDMEFNEYSEDQLFSIMLKRAEKALLPNSFDEKLIKKIARSVEDGSARVAIERLWKSAKHAEEQRKTKIMIQDFEDILVLSSDFKKSELNLSEEENFILEILKEKALSSTETYENFSKKFTKSKRQIRNYLDSLEKTHLVESENAKSQGMLNLRIFKLIRKN